MLELLLLSGLLLAQDEDMLAETIAEPLLVGSDVSKQILRDTSVYCEGNVGRLDVDISGDRAGIRIAVVTVGCLPEMHNARLCTQRQFRRIAIVLPDDRVQYAHDPPGSVLRAWQPRTEDGCGQEFDAFSIEGDVPIDVIEAVSRDARQLADDAGLELESRGDPVILEHGLSSLMPFFSEPDSDRYCAGYKAADDSETFVCFEKKGDRLVPFDSAGRP